MCDRTSTVAWIITVQDLSVFIHVGRLQSNINNAISMWAFFLTPKNINIHIGSIKVLHQLDNDVKIVQSVSYLSVCTIPCLLLVVGFLKSQCKTEPDQNENATMDHFSLLPEQMNWTTSVKAPLNISKNVGWIAKEVHTFMLPRGWILLMC